MEDTQNNISLIGFDIVGFPQNETEQVQITQNPSNGVISSNYIKWLLSPVEIFDRSGEKVNYYRNSWWYAIVDNKEIFYARGYLGQYIVTIPELNLVFVRLGKKEKNKNTKNNNYDMSENLEFLISEIIKLYS